MISTSLNHILTQYKDMLAMSSDFSTVHFEMFISFMFSFIDMVGSRI